MKSIVIGAHLLRDDVEPLAEAIPVGDLFLSAISIADDQPVGDRELLLKVADVRGKLLDVATFVAIRYGFTIGSADEALGKCAAHFARWKRLLTAHREHVEMTLKVAASSPQTRPDRHDFQSGAEYLKALHATMQATNVSPEFRKEADRLFSRAIQKRWQHRDEKSVELAMLVKREDVEAVMAAGEELRKTGTPFLLSGPWPLEVFADDSHE